MHDWQSVRCFATVRDWRPVVVLSNNLWSIYNPATTLVEPTVLGCPQVSTVADAVTGLNPAKILVLRDVVTAAQCVAGLGHGG